MILYAEVLLDASLILKLAQSSLEKSTLKNYGSGLFRFHQFCNEREIPESSHMPASVFLLAAFVTWASTRNIVSKTIGTWLSGIHGWHMLHGAPWYGGDDFVSLIKTSAVKKAPASSRPKHRPVSIDYLLTLQGQLNFCNSFDVAVFTVALCAFWGCCQLGELTIPSCNAFNPHLHTSKSVHINYQDHIGGVSSNTFHIPWDKMKKQDGANLIFMAWDVLCPVKALKHHLEINKDIPGEALLFSFITLEGVWALITKQWFLDHCQEIWIPLQLDFIHRHSFQPGGVTELLLADVPPETVAKQGQWKLLAFLIYWCKLEDLIPSMINSTYSSACSSDLQNTFEHFHITNKLPDRIDISW